MDSGIRIKIIYPKVTVGYFSDARLYHSKLPGSTIVSMADVDKNPTYSLVNLHINNVPNRRIMDSARINILMVNHELGKEYYSDENHLLERMNLVLCKNQAAVDAMTALQKKHDNLKFEILLTKHTSDFPEFKGDIIKDKDPKLILHSAGMHQWKQTGKVVSTWIKYPELPKIIITCADYCLVNLRKYFKDDVKGFNVKDFPRKLPKNIEFHTKALDMSELIKLKHRAAIHLMPSIAEGYGFAISESRNSKSITITTDHPPMNELINKQSGFLVKCTSFMPLPCDVKGCVTTEDEIYKAVKNALALSNEDRVRMGNAAYQQHLDEKKIWNAAMDNLWTWIREKARFAEKSPIHRLRSTENGDKLAHWMQDRIRQRIQSDLQPFKYRMEEFKRMEKLMWSTPKMREEIMRVEIRDSIAYGYNMDFTVIPGEKTGNILRGPIILNMINRSLNYMKSKGKYAPDCIMYIMYGDTYMFQQQDLPMFTIVKPNNRNGILLPDNTFLSHPPDVEKNQYDWDTTKQLSKDYCVTVKNSQENVLYFKGCDTTAHRHNVRKIVADYQGKDPQLPLKIELITINSFTPVWEMCKYKYLLNLPGNQPWSFRKKFLLMLPSLMIDVVVKSCYGKDRPGEWINFFDQLFVPGIDYARVTVDWNQGVFRPLEKKDASRMMQEIKQIYDKYERDPGLYENTVKSANQKIQLINHTLIYRTVYSLIVHYAKCVSRDGGPTKMSDIIDSV